MHFVRLAETVLWRKCVAFPSSIAVDSPVKMRVEDASTCGEALHRDVHSGIGLPFLEQTSQTDTGDVFFGDRLF